MDFATDVMEPLSGVLDDDFWAEARAAVLASEHVSAVYTDRFNSDPSELTDGLIAPLRELLEKRVGLAEEKHFLRRRATGQYVEFGPHVVHGFMRDYSVNYPDQFQMGATMVDVARSGLEDYVEQWLNASQFDEQMEDSSEMPDDMLVMRPWDSPHSADHRVATVTDMARQRTCYHGCSDTCHWSSEPPEQRQARHQSHVQSVEAQVETLRDLVAAGPGEEQDQAADRLNEMLSLEPGTVRAAIRNGWPV